MPPCHMCTWNIRVAKKREIIFSEITGTVAKLN